MHRRAFTALAAAAVATGALSVPAADAATLEQLINANNRFTFEDDSVEDLGVDGGNPGRLDVGDTVRGVISFPFFKSTPTGARVPLNGTTNSAAHGLFEIEVTEKVFDRTLGGFDQYNFKFGPHDGFAADVGGVDGAMIALWENNTELNPTACGTKATCEAAATAGALRLVLGFEEGRNNIWGASGRDDLPALTELAQGSNAARFGFRIDVLQENLDVLPFIDLTDPSEIPGEDVPVGIPAQAVGSGQILGTAGLDTEYVAIDDVDIQMAVVPIPAALPLFLAGMGALGMIGWRRNAA